MLNQMEITAGLKNYEHWCKLFILCG